ncbi:MAG: glutamate racemase [Leptospirales bacterium]|nr:glutamate racemase [Leptospirales bacterium]
MPAPLGVFDSGIGGVSILLEIRKLLKSEDVIYFADSAWCPYGTKPIEQIRERTLKITDFLVSQNSKAVVVACNTACSAGLDLIRDKNRSIPVIGVEPAVKPAQSITRNGKIGVLSTNRTLQGEKFSMLIEKFGNGVEIFTQPAPGLAELVDQGKKDEPETAQLLGDYLRPLLARGIDTLVLGCTHYPFLSDKIREICGSSVALVDTGLAVAKQTERVLRDQNIASDEGIGRVNFYTSGDEDFVKRVLETLWPEVIENVTYADI